MDCRQVDKLAYLYCDNEIQAHLRKDLEKHLSECPECRVHIENTMLETEALRFRDDVPELSPDFKNKVILAITGGKPSEEYVPRSLFTRMKYKYFTGGNLFMGSMAAAVLVLMIFIPGLTSFEQVNKAPSPSRHQQLASEKKSIKSQPVTDEKAETPVLMVETSASSASKYDNSFKPFYTVPAVYGTSDQAAPDRGEGTGSSYQLGSESVPVSQPAYLPNGYYLSNIESDMSNNLSMYYENGSGGSFVVKVAEVLLNRASKEALSPPLLVGAPPVTTEDSAFKVMKSADTTSVNDPAYVSTNLSKGQKTYRVELSGNLDQRELKKVASSIK